ncbi:MAG: hypothetical protein RL198_101 [Actinomycetota bacterium]
MGRLFGTDGVRGTANELLTPELSQQLGAAAAKVLSQSALARGERPAAVLARDPRSSSDFIAAAVASGMAGAGVDVFDAGVVPTPAAAYLTADFGADFGVMISASHNPAPDNGIKFFAAGGLKLADAIEDQIEAELANPLRPTGAAVGRIARFSDAEDRYLVHLLATLPNRLGGLRVVLDCANGAASTVAPQLFRDAGAEIYLIGHRPDGNNINLGCGSTDMAALQSEVINRGADLGLAFDGDADRCLAVDASGAVVNGDQIMGILALAEKAAGRLSRDTLVATVMSNLGLRIAMKEAGIQLVETRVGDRYVIEEMRSGNYSLGGEQSGHIVFARHATTGDGLLTGLQLAIQLVQTGRSLAELASVVQIYPQVLLNVRGVDHQSWQQSEPVILAIQTVEAALGNRGRVLVRASGTEAMIRVMVEAESESEAEALSSQIAEVIRQELTL